MNSEEIQDLLLMLPMFTQLVKCHLFIYKFSDKITHVHIIDNDGKYVANKKIRNGNIDWKTVVDADRKA